MKTFRREASTSWFRTRSSIDGRGRRVVGPGMTTPVRRWGHELPPEPLAAYISWCMDAYHRGRMTAGGRRGSVAAMTVDRDLPWWRPPVVDALVAAAVLAVRLLGTAILLRLGGGDPIDVVGYTLLAATAVPLAYRNRFPGPVLLAVAAVAVVYTWLGYPGPGYTLALVFAVWAAVSAGHRALALGVVVALVLNIVRRPRRSGRRRPAVARGHAPPDRRVLDGARAARLAGFRASRPSPNASARSWPSSPGVSRTTRSPSC
jgi:hypothetical protein